MPKSMTAKRRKLKTGKPAVSKVRVAKVIKVPKLRPAAKAGVLAVVRRMLAKNTENKVVAWSPENLTLHNSAITGADCEPLVQEIYPINNYAATGGIATVNTSCLRIGDRITPKSLVVRGILSFNQAQVSNTNQTIYVRVIIAAQKDIKNGFQVASGSVDANRLLRPGFALPVNADQAPFQGLTGDLLYPPNKDKFRIYMDKIIKMDPAALTTLTGWSGPFPSYSKRWSYTFDHTKLPTALTFDEGAGNWPNNFAPFVAIGYAFSDGTTDPSGTLRIMSTIHSQLTFEDA